MAKQTIVFTGVNLHVEELNCIIHGDWHKVGDCVVAYITKQRISLDITNPAPIHIFVPRFATHFHRDPYEDPYGVFIVREQDCELFVAGQEHVRHWTRGMHFNFKNFKYSRSSIMATGKLPQLTKQGNDIKRIIRGIEAQVAELELCILKEPTEYPREEMTSANIMIQCALRDHLFNIV